MFLIKILYLKFEILLLPRLSEILPQVPYVVPKVE